MFGPLSFQDVEQESNLPSKEAPCLLCDEKFAFKQQLPTFLKHVFDSHHLVIEDAQNIDNLDGYITYWKNKFKSVPVEEILPAITVSFTDQKYLVLSTLQKEDREIRHKLKLEEMLRTQEMERNDTNFTRSCLFCRLNFQGKRSEFLQHLNDNHNLWLGNPQNLVYIDEFLNEIDRKLEDLKCLYCEKTFTDRAVLKEHMRKKQHKRINPSNDTYDKYYAINYLDPDRKWQRLNKETDASIPYLGDSENTDKEYEDWKESESLITCLFCSLKTTHVNELCLHMSSKHHFNFYVLTRHLDFYQKLKLVNYVRRQIHNLHCVYCDASFENLNKLDEHMEKDKHYQLPDVHVYDQPEFFFPTYENDSFLYFLEEIDD